MEAIQNEQGRRGAEDRTSEDLHKDMCGVCIKKCFNTCIDPDESLK